MSAVTYQTRYGLIPVVETHRSEFAARQHAYALQHSGVVRGPILVERVERMLRLEG